MTPSLFSALAAILGQLQTDRFIGAKLSFLKRFGFGQGTQDKYSVSQIIRDLSLSFGESVFLAIKGNAR